MDRVAVWSESRIRVADHPPQMVEMENGRKFVCSLIIMQDAEMMRMRGCQNIEEMKGERLESTCAGREIVCTARVHYRL